jgi:threonine/homoserine/homoserine lactone efflux protein
VTYSLVGIGLVIARSPLLFAIIQYSGAAYLLYLGVQSFASASTSDTLGTATSHDLSAAQAVRSGFLTNALNPKASLFFLSVFSQVVQESTPTALKILYGVEMSIVTFLWFAAVALVLSALITPQAVCRGATTARKNHGRRADFARATRCVCTYWISQRTSFISVFR